jgi:hypothetical protein
MSLGEDRVESTREDTREHAFIYLYIFLIIINVEKVSLGEDRVENTREGIAPGDTACREHARTSVRLSRTRENTRPPVENARGDSSVSRTRARG